MRWTPVRIAQVLKSVVDKLNEGQEPLRLTPLEAEAIIAAQQLAARVATGSLPR